MLNTDFAYKIQQFTELLSNGKGLSGVDKAYLGSEKVNSDDVVHVTQEERSDKDGMKISTGSWHQYQSNTTGDVSGSGVWKRPLTKIPA